MRSVSSSTTRSTESPSFVVFTRRERAQIRGGKRLERLSDWAWHAKVLGGVGTVNVFRQN